MELPSNVKFKIADKIIRNIIALCVRLPIPIILLKIAQTLWFFIMELHKL